MYKQYITITILLKLKPDFTLKGWSEMNVIVSLFIKPIFISLNLGSKVHDYNIKRTRFSLQIEPPTHLHTVHMHTEESKQVQPRCTFNDLDLE